MVHHLQVQVQVQVNFALFAVTGQQSTLVLSSHRIVQHILAILCIDKVV